MPDTYGEGAVAALHASCAGGPDACGLSMKEGGARAGCDLEVAG